MVPLCTEFEADCSIRSKVIKEVQKLGIITRDPGHAHIGVVLWSLQREAPSSVCTKFEADSSIRSNVIRVSQNFEIRSRDPKPRPLRGRFIMRTQGGSILYVYSLPNLKRIALFVQKLLGGPKISNLGQVTLNHAHFGVIL